ncbi:intermembrane transport protein PqiB [Alkalimonas collagenimarina]|uniref:Intermembrane transport protein PqiB n=1 Tax=Alkalimonas collagenimarina TaxID=400390 RepID=A0ABT9GXC8_9GAMM|nr:intermembrane transport protein PqiB [Alkalimonas collagenimarina]MDP4535524.1 intermembrane transport protein PqiB [Alkalimonas collagenimarina]
MTAAIKKQASVQAIRQWSPIWIVPLAAVGIGIWMLYYSIQNQGPLVTLVAPHAEGVIAGKTSVKSRSVDVGQVVSVDLTSDLKQVEIKVRMRPDTEPLLTSESQFWVVRPQISRSGITGLNTLLSGAYIELLPGDAGRLTLQHNLLDTPPIAPADAAGIRIRLHSDDTGLLTIGDPVLYRGFEVGTVELTSFDIAERRMAYQLFIRSPYDSLVTENVRFWLASGVSFDVTAEGVRVDLASIATLVSGGVSFDVMEGWPMGAPVATNTEFVLFPTKSSIQEGMYSEYLEYLLFFEESVRGLKAGAPVEYRGIRIGTVISVPFFFSMASPLETSIDQGVPVLIRLETGRLHESISTEQLKLQLEHGVEQGLRAILKTSSLLTGGLYIDLDRVDDAEVLEASMSYAGYATLPTARGGLSNIEQKVLLALDKITQLPVEPLLNEGTRTLAQTTAVMLEVEQLVNRLDSYLQQPAWQQAPEQLQQSLLELQQVLQSFGPDSETHQRLNNNLQSFEQLQRELQPLLRTLNQRSNALIFQATPEPDPEPKRARP